MTERRRLTTVIESLYFEAKREGSKGVTFIGDDGREEQVSYLQVLEGAHRIANGFKARGVTAREVVLLALPTSPAFAFSYFGILLAGAVPCPLPLPQGFGDASEFTSRVAYLARYLGAHRAVASDAFVPLLRGTGVEALSPLALSDDQEDDTPDGGALTASDVALIQCTSASTGEPKGVLLTHENLIANVHQIGFALGHREDDVYVAWLPLYHDMGLIGCLLSSIYWNLDSVFLSPVRFLRRPASWLQAIAKHRGTISPAPNFAYGYVTARAKDEELEGVDLSSWRIAGCGAEPIDPRTLLAFAERFRRYGLPATAPTPCYGLAEATLAVSFHPVGKPLEYDRVSRAGIAEGEVRAPADARDEVLVASCGAPMAETEVRILGPDGAPLPEERVGRVQVRGPSVMKGYHARPDDPALKDGWLETGDLGYRRGGQLRITGRSKDVIIIRGRKYPPTDFEWAAEELPQVRKSNAVAFGVHDPLQGTEALHLLCETDVTDPEQQEALRAAIKAHVAGKTQVTPAVVALVPRGFVPKTSSGKLQRGRARELWLRQQG